MNKTASSAAPSMGRFILNSLVSAIIAALGILIMNFLAAIILNMTDNPEGFYSICAIIIYVISSVISGVIAKRKNKTSALFSGLLSGGFIILMLFIIPLVVPMLNTNTPWWQILILPAGAVLGALFVK